MISDEYAAGFFDGEGCILLIQNRGTSSLRVTLAQVDLAPLMLFQERWGGRIGLKDNSINGPRATSYWIVSSASAIAPLKAMLPYLIVKKTQAEIAIRHQERVTGRRRRGTFRRLAPEEVALREAESIALKTLKRMTSLDDPAGVLSTLEGGS